MRTEERSSPGGLGEAVMRSLFPLVACGLLLLVPLIGPWALLVLTFAWWRVVTRIG